MKKFIFVLMTVLGTFWITEAYAGKPLVAEAPVSDHGTSSSVSASTSTWTEVTHTDGMIGMFVTLDPDAATDVYGNFDNTCSTTTKAIVFKAGMTQFIPCSEQDPLYVVAPTAAKTVYYCPVKQ